MRHGVHLTNELYLTKLEITQVIPFSLLLSFSASKLLLFIPTLCSYPLRLAFFPFWYYNLIVFNRWDWRIVRCYIRVASAASPRAPSKPVVGPFGLSTLITRYFSFLFLSLLSLFHFILSYSIRIDLILSYFISFLFLSCLLFLSSHYPPIYIETNHVVQSFTSQQEGFVQHCPINGTQARRAEVSSFLTWFLAIFRLFVFFIFHLLSYSIMIKKIFKLNGAGERGERRRPHSKDNAKHDAEDLLSDWYQRYYFASTSIPSPPPISITHSPSFLPPPSSLLPLTNFLLFSLLFFCRVHT